MDCSFKDFATNFAGLSLPTSITAVAKSLNFSPISLRALMNLGAPDEPSSVNANASPGGTLFWWFDPVSAPPWFYPPGNQLIIATSWLLELFEVTSNNSEGVQIISATINRVPQDAFDYIYYAYTDKVLTGNFICLVTAYNSYGGTSTGLIPLTIEFTSEGPSISVESYDINVFQLKGSGFTPNKKVKINANRSISTPHNAIPPVSATADSEGNLTTSPPVLVNCTSICTMYSGSNLTFQAIDNSTGNMSNQFSTLFCQ
jgi:hypothetical protein